MQKMRNEIKSESPIKVGVSTCLLGQKVRFDGGHKHDHYLTDILGPHFRFVPVCPELEVGMGVPREAVRLEGDIEAPRMVGNKTGDDWTDRMNDYAQTRVLRSDLADLSGYILKKNSPSCGMERVKIHVKPGTISKTGVGLFASALINAYPHLPVEEEGRLHDDRLRDNFIVRVFAYYRLRQTFRGRFSRKAAVDFHAAHKYLMLAHSPVHYKKLGQLVAAINKYPPAEFREKYHSLFMEGLSVMATARKNVNVLQHIMGFLKTRLSAEEKKDILSVIEDYHRGLVPLIVPITLVRHYLNKFEVEYISDQVYLNPHPKELMLRNHV
jgi:uncharacterized protein YbgA (DUF1722 family)/uncharacterized protein YbbK (DUF523 family)